MGSQPVEVPASLFETPPSPWVHALFVHVWPDAQATPQTPQFEALVAVFTQ
jgi:hypothetical protein